MHYEHANCYGDCSTQIEELGQAFPTCHSVMQMSFQRFINKYNQQNFLSFIRISHIECFSNDYCYSKLQNNNQDYIIW